MKSRNITTVLIISSAFSLAALILLLFRREWTEGIVVCWAGFFMLVSICESRYAIEWMNHCDEWRELCERSIARENQNSRARSYLIGELRRVVGRLRAFAERRLDIEKRCYIAILADELMAAAADCYKIGANTPQPPKGPAPAAPSAGDESEEAK